MNYKNYFEENNLNDINTFFQFMKNEFKYGWKDQKGYIHEGINDGLNYSLQSPEELLQSKVGICWDRTELYRCYFENMTSLKYETYYLFYDDNLGCPSHSILVYYDNDKVYWFEPMFNDEKYYYCGIHEYYNINDLLSDFVNKFLESSIINEFIPNDYDISNLFLYKYLKPNYHINGYEMREHIDNSKRIIFHK